MTSSRFSFKWLIASFAFMTFFGSASAYEPVSASGISEGSLDWQKVRLEDQIQTKLTDSLARVLPASSFVATVSIKLKPQRKLAHMDLNPKPNDKKGTQKDTAKPTAPADISPELLSLGKIGLDLPIIFSNDGKLSEEARDKIERDLAPETPPQPNVFDEIEHWSISILLDETLGDEKKTLVTHLARKVSESVGKEAEITVEKSKLLPPPPVEKTQDTRQLLTQLSLPIGLLAGSALFCLAILISVLMISGSYKKLENRKISILEAQAAREEAQAQAEKPASETAVSAEPQAAAQEAAAPAVSVSQQSGLEKFRALLAQSPEKAATLVRQWLKTPAEGVPESLSALSQFLSSDEFSVLFRFLDNGDRACWKKSLSTKMDAAGLARADGFISSQIVELLLSPNHSALEPELIKSVEELALTEAVELASSNPELGGLLINMLPAIQVNRLFSLLPADIASNVITNGLKFSDEELKKKSSLLTTSIAHLKKGARSSNIPFLDQAPSILGEMDPDRERAFFSALAESREFSVLAASARKCFPSELAMKLPPKAVKAAMDRLGSRKRADFLFSLKPEDRSLMIEAYGKAGSKSREVIDADLQQVQLDELRKKKIEKGKAELWRDFIASTRGLLLTNEALREQSDEILQAWLNEKSGGEHAA
jgi:hypothetical protein